MSETTADSCTVGLCSTLAAKENLPWFTRGVPFAAMSRVRDGRRRTPAGTSRGGRTVLASPESGRASNLKGEPEGVEQVSETLLRDDEDDLLMVLMALTLERDILLASSYEPEYFLDVADGLRRSRSRPRLGDGDGEAKRRAGERHFARMCPFRPQP